MTDATWTVHTAPHPKIDKLSEPTEVTPPAYGPKPSYLESSQARHWMFSAQELQRQKQEAHDHAASLLRSATDAEASIEPLSAEEEVAIIRFYLLRIGKIVKAFGLPSLIEATAMTLMKRFYLRNSCMQFHPKLIMYVSKARNSYPG